MQVFRPLPAALLRWVQPIVTTPLICEDEEMSHGHVTAWLPPSVGNDGSKVTASHRSRGHWSAGTRLAFGRSYLCMAASLRQEGVKLPWRLEWRSAQRSLAALQQVLHSTLSHEALGDLHRRYVARLEAMTAQRRILQLGPTPTLGNARCARSGIAWHALNRSDGWWRRS